MTATTDAAWEQQHATPSKAAATGMVAVDLAGQRGDHGRHRWNAEAGDAVYRSDGIAASAMFAEGRRSPKHNIPVNSADLYQAPPPIAEAKPSAILPGRPIRKIQELSSGNQATGIAEASGSGNGCLISQGVTSMLLLQHHLFSRSPSCSAAPHTTAAHAAFRSLAVYAAEGASSVDTSVVTCVISLCTGHLLATFKSSCRWASVNAPVISSVTRRR